MAETRRYKFHWDIIGDLDAGRPHLGKNVRLELYRLLQYTFRDVLEARYSTEACDKIFTDAGMLAGHVFFDRFLSEFKALEPSAFFVEFQRVLREFGIGILRLEKTDLEAGHFILSMAEDLDCSGLPDLGIEVCAYDEGFLAAIFESYLGKPFVAKEVDCWCTGDRTCRFEVKVAS